jgi:hypothetical protein
MGDLGTFEGREIEAVGVIVRKTGDGLSETVKVEPTLALDVRVGDEGFIVFAYKCVDVHHPATNRKEPAEGGVKRVPVLDAGTATFVEGATVEEAIKLQREKNMRYAEEQRGQHELTDAELVEAHDRGEHDGDVFPVEHCPRCADEVAAVEREAAEDAAS